VSLDRRIRRTHVDNMNAFAILLFLLAAIAVDIWVLRRLYDIWVRRRRARVTPPED